MTMRSENLVTVKYLWDNEPAGYQADVEVTIKAIPGCPGDDVTPPTRDEYHVLDANVVDIDFGGEPPLSEFSDAALAKVKEMAKAAFLLECDVNEALASVIEQLAEYKLTPIDEQPYFRRPKRPIYCSTVQKPF